MAHIDHHSRGGIRLAHLGKPVGTPSHDSLLRHLYARRSKRGAGLADESPLYVGRVFRGITGPLASGLCNSEGCSYVNEGAGIPPWTYTPFAHLAYPAFRAWATLFTALFVWLYAGLLAWAFRPVLTGLRDGWKSRKPSRPLPSKPLLMQHNRDSAVAGNTGSHNPDSST